MGCNMKELLKRIRESVGISQAEMGVELGVSFATINRWENGRAIPNQLAQNKIYEFCTKHGVPLYQFILDKVEAAAKSVVLEDGRVLLYHGSKSGIVGKIAPISRDRCDFGKGFYMGTDPAQPLTLVCDFPESKFYIVSVEMKGLAVKEIPADIEWAMIVAYNRGRMDRIKGTAYYNRYRDFMVGCDLVIGSIANDRMFYVIDNFFAELITDQALVKSLAALQLGVQYVMLTQKGCDAVRIEREVELSDLERQCLREVSGANREKGIALATEICKDYRREGKFFDEILTDAIKGEN